MDEECFETESRDAKAFAAQFGALSGGVTLQRHGIGPREAQSLYALYHFKDPAWVLLTPIALLVPFAQKERAKQLGARWGGKEWIVPPGTDILPFFEWLPHGMATAGTLQRRRQQQLASAAAVVSELATFLDHGSHNVHTTPLNTAWCPCTSPVCRLCHRQATYGRGLDTA